MGSVLDTLHRALRCRSLGWGMRSVLFMLRLDRQPQQRPLLSPDRCSLVRCRARMTPSGSFQTFERGDDDTWQRVLEPNYPTEPGVHAGRWGYKVALSDDGNVLMVGTKGEGDLGGLGDRNNTEVRDVGEFAVFEWGRGNGSTGWGLRASITGTLRVMSTMLKSGHVPLCSALT